MSQKIQIIIEELFIENLVYKLVVYISSEFPKRN